MKITHYFNVPTILTLIRLIGSPIILPLLLVYLLPFNLFGFNFFLGVIFLLLSSTDFFDGYLARKYKQETVLGKILDPLADKFLLYATMVALLAADKLSFYWVILFIGREFFVMGLRQVALEYDFAIDVSLWGKSKTCMQMVTMLIIIVNPYQMLGIYGSSWNVVEIVCLGITSMLSIVSAWYYYRAFMKKFVSEYVHCCDEKRDGHE